MNLPTSVIDLLSEIKSKQKNNNSCFMHRQLLLQEIDKLLAENEVESYTSFIQILKDILLCFQIYDKYDHLINTGNETILQSDKIVLMSKELIELKNINNHRQVPRVRRKLKLYQFL